MPRMFNHQNQEECDKLINSSIFKISNAELYEKFMNKFKDEVKKFAHKDFEKRQKNDLKQVKVPYE